MKTAKLFISAAIACAAVIAPAHASEMWLTMDQVRPLSLDRAAGSIVVGNPAIADVTVQSNNRVFLFGKAPGLTNVFIFDEDGKPIDNVVIRVRVATSGMLVFNRGMSQATYNCTDRCERTITVGDSNNAFTEVSNQVQQKAQQARTAANQGDN